MNHLLIGLRGFALLALLLLAWHQFKARRDCSRAERQQALADGRSVFGGSRVECDERASQLADRGIRSWIVKRDGQRQLVVGRGDEPTARKVLGGA